MAFLGNINIVGSRLTAQQLRLDIISENITNLNTTHPDANEDGYLEMPNITPGQKDYGRYGRHPATQECARAG